MEGFIHSLIYNRLLTNYRALGSALGKQSSIWCQHSLEDKLDKCQSSTCMTSLWQTLCEGGREPVANKTKSPSSQNLHSTAGFLSQHKHFGGWLSCGCFVVFRELYSPNTTSTHSPEWRKCLQTLPGVPWGTKLLPLRTIGKRKTFIIFQHVI